MALEAGCCQVATSFESLACVQGRREFSQPDNSKSLSQERTVLDYWPHYSHEDGAPKRLVKYCQNYVARDLHCALCTAPTGTGAGDPHGQFFNSMSVIVCDEVANQSEAPSRSIMQMHRFT